MGTKHKTKVSIIIPFNTHEHLLKKCLEAISNQTFKDFEVIVIYNGKEDKNKDLVEDFGFIWAKEEKIGSYSARNTGIKLAKGEIITFTDADCIPDKFWLENAIKILDNNPEKHLLGCKLNMIFKDSSKPRSYEMYEEIIDFNQKYFVEVSHSSCTSNLFVRKTIFDKIGYFDDEFKSLGDYAFTKKASDAGFNLSYSDKPIVFHPTRDSFKSFIKKQERIAGGVYILLKNRSSNIFDLFIKIFTSDILDSIRSAKSLQRENLTLISKIKLILLINLVHQIALWEQIKIVFGERIKTD